MVFCGIDHREDVEAQPLEDELELVDQGDVARAEDVFGELDCLGGGSRGDGHDLRDEAAVEGRGEGHGVRLVGADDLGNAAGGEGRVARVLALGAVGDEHGLARNEAGSRQHRGHHLGCGAGPGGRFEHDQAAGSEVRNHRVQRAGDEGEIGLAVWAQWRGHADQDGVDRGDLGEVGGGDEAAGFDHGPNAGMADMLERAPAGIEAVDLGPVDVEAGDPEPRRGRGQHQGQPHITHADDAEPGVAPGQAIQEVGRVHDRAGRRLSRRTRA